MSVQSVYIALFGRPADPEGLAYWNSVTNNGANLTEMLRVLPGLPEYTQRFEGKSNAEVVTEVYVNLFGRQPDAEGLAFFTDALVNGTQSIATIAVNILDGAQNDDLADVQAKETAANLFTASLDTPEKIAAYTGDVAAQGARAFLDNVDSERPATPESVQVAVEAVEAGDPTGGQEPDEDEDDEEDDEDPVDPGPVDPGPVDPGPVDTPTSRFGEVSAIAKDGAYLIAGTGNSAGNFNITTTSLSQIEIALKGYKRFEGDALDHEDGVYHFGNDKVGFAYSIASLDGKSLEELMDEGYSFHLAIDNFAGSGWPANINVAGNFTLEANVDTAPKKAADSGYNWVGQVNGLPMSIFDDEGDTDDQLDGTVTQNIQTPIWYGAMSSGDIPVNGEYSVSLTVKKDGSTIATEEILLDVDSNLHSIYFNDRLSNIAETAPGEMIVGDGNSSEHFRLVHLDLDKSGNVDLELALGGQIRKGDAFVPLGHGLMTTVGGGTPDGIGAPMFKYSVASIREDFDTLLARYDIKLFVDTDHTTATNFVELTAVSDGANGLDWTFGSQWKDKNGNTPRLVDDEGSARVSQNIQALGWYQPEPGNKLFTDYASDFGFYKVSLAVFDKGTTNLVGINTVDFRIDTPVGP